MTTASRALTFDFDSATFGVGTLTASLLSTTSSPPTTTGGIATDTSLPPKMTTIVTASASSASASAKPTSSGPSTGQTIGITVGVVVGACLLTCLIFLFCWKRKRKISGKRSAVNDHYTRGNLRQTYQTRAPNQVSHHTGASRQTAWPRSINPEEIGVAITPSERQGFIKRLTTSKPLPMPILPISAPVMGDRTSVRDNFRDRFFAEPSPIPPSAKGTAKHVSDTTTIRTSCNPPTPSRPPLAVLRPYSTRTSTATTFEEDVDYLDKDIPPVPTFTAVEIPLKSTSVRKKGDKPSRLDLETGIMRNFSKAISHIPMTPRYDNGNFDSSKKSAVPFIPRSRLRTSKSMDTQKSKYVEGTTVSAPPVTATPPRQMNPLPVQGSPDSVYPDIPERESSLRNFQMKSDEEWLLQGSNKTTPHSDKARVPRQPPLSAGRTEHSAITSPIHNLTYPRIPISASETSISLKVPALRSPFQPRSSQAAAVSAENIERYSNRPLPSLVVPTDLDDPFEGPSRGSRPAQRPQPPSRPSVSSSSATTDQDRLQIYYSSDFPSSRAVFTPNRTNTGDLVLMVDL